MQDNNPYLNFLDEQEKKSPSTSPAGVANPYLSMLDQQERSEEIRRRSTLGGAIGGDADAEARARKLAQDLNLPPGAVRGMGLDQAQRQQQLQQIDQNTQQTPTLKRRYTSADFAAIAHDDSQNLGPLERLLTEIGGRGFAKDAALSKISELGAKTTFGQSLTPYEEIELQDAKKRLERLAREQEGRGDLSYVMNVGTAAVSQFVRGVPTGLVGAAGGAAVAAPVAAGGALLAGQFGPQVAAPEEIVTVPVAAIGGALWGGRMGFAAGTLYYNYQQIVGSSYELEYSQYRDENGKPLAPEIAIGAAHLNAMLGVGLETVADLTLAKTVPGLEKFLSAPGKDVVNKLLASETGRNALIRIGKKIGTASGIEGLTEAAQQAIQILVGEGAKLVDQGEFAPITLPEAGQQIATAAIEGAIGGGFIAGATAPVQVVIENRELKKAEIEGRTSVREINRLEAAIDAAGKTKLIERDRGELERFVDEAAADGPVSTIYLSAEDLASVATTAGLEPRQLAQQLGVADQIQTSATTNSLLEMPIGKFIATVAGTDLAAPLTQVIKTNPFLLNRMEQEAFASNGRADVIAEADRLVQEALTDETFAAEAQSIQDEVLQQFRSIEGGEVFTPEVSRAYTTITTQTYVSLARRLGISPREAYERYQRGPLKIERQAGPVEGVGQPVMEQAQTEGYTGQSIGEAQEWVRARAKGLDMSQPARMARAVEAGFDTGTVLYHGSPNREIEEFRTGWGVWGNGVYLTNDKRGAREYKFSGAKYRSPSLSERIISGVRGKLYEVYVRGDGMDAGDYINEMSERKLLNARLPYAERKTDADLETEYQAELSAAGITHTKAKTGTFLVFDPSNIRSVNAAFDPEFAESANILAQSAVDLQRAPTAIQGTGPGGRVLNRDLGQFLTDRHMATYGRALDPDDPADYEIILNSMIEDYNEQAEQSDTGDAWYTDDINEAIRLTSAIYPALQSSPTFRDLYLTVAALLSPQQKPVANWDNAVFALRSWEETGRLELLKPNGKQFGVLSHTNGLRMLQHLVDTLGLEGALQWVQTEHTGREMAEMRMASGIFAPIDKATGKASTKVKDYLPSETNLNESKLGIYAFGPKVGDFMQNSVGIDQNAVTVDLWLARTYNRYIGRLMDVSPKQAEEGAIASELRGRAERENIKRLVRDAAAKAGLDASAMQAALWYFEQRLYRNFGIKSESQNFSGAARAALKSRGIDVPELAESDQRAAGQDAVQGAGPREARDTEESLGQTKRNLDALGFYSAVQEAALRVPDGIWQLGWNAARNAIAKGRGGVPPRRTEMEYLGLDAMFGDTKVRPGDNFPRKGPALKEAVLEHIAAKRLSLVEIFTRFDPNVKAPTKAQILDEIDDDTLGFMMGVAEFSMGFEEGRIVASELDGADEFHTGLFVRANKQEVSDDPVKRYDMPRRTYNLYRGLNLPGKRELVATGVIGDLLGKAARIILNENRNLVMRKISAADMRDYWEQSRTTESAGLVRGPGDIRLPGEDVPLFEAVIGLPKGVPGADYQAPISHVGGKAKGTLVTAHGEERVDDKGQRTIFVGQVQSDMAQEARRGQEASRETAEALRVYEFNGSFWVGMAPGVSANGPYASIKEANARLDFLREVYLTEEDIPLLSTSEWTNVAVRAMVYRAARQGFQSISFPTGRTSTIIQGNNDAVMHYETNVKGALEKIAKQFGGEVRRGSVEYDQDDPDINDQTRQIVRLSDGTEISRGELIESLHSEYGLNTATAATMVADALYRDLSSWTGSTRPRQTIKAAQYLEGLAPTGKMVEFPELGRAPAYILDLTPAIREEILVEGFSLFQERRGEYVPNLNTIRMLPKADWSSYLHEMGHHFLEVYNNAALQIEKIPEADRTPDEQKIVDDMRVLLTDMARQADVQIMGDVLQWWANTPLAGRTPVHEKYAEATEKYFMEGKAPVPELQALFDRFKTWLLDVYKNLTALKVELTPEVRGVMDRMYAAHETVRTAEYNRKLVALFREKPEAMTDQEWTAYQQIAAQATSDAQDDLTARSLRDMQWLSGARARVLRDMQRDNADKRKLVRAEVAAEVMARPVNVARSFFRRGIAPNGEPVTGAHKLNIDLLKARYPDISGVDWKRLGYGQYGMLAKDGIDPDMAAEMLGYPSGDALVTSLLSAVPAEPEIDTETDRRMLERFGDLNDEVKMSKAADDVIHSAMRAKVLQAEYAALIKASKQTKPLVIAAKEIAREIVGRQLASKLNLNKYLAAERAAGRKAEAAMRSGDFAAAASAKRDQLLNFEVVREAQRVLKERDKALDLFSRINKAKRETVAKTRNYDLVQAARAVLAAYGFGSMKNQPIDYMAAVKAYDPALYSALEPTILAAVTAGKTLDQLTVTEFMGLRDTVRQFWDLSRQEMKVDIEGRQLDLEDIVQDLNGQLEAQGAAPKGPSTEAPTEWQQRLRQFAGLKASMRRVETWARLFDRGKVGAFTRFIWRPVSEAADRYRTDRNTYILRFRELFRAIEPTMGGGKINAPEINYTFKNKSELLHAILHTGNGSNYRKLLLGRGWGTEDQDGNLIDNAWQNLINRLSQEGVINKADFDFAQSVWDLLDEIKPLAQATHKQVFGSYFAEITAEAVQTPFGTYKGGYVPAVYDTYNVQDAALRAQQEAVEANDSTMFPSPASGFTKSRVEYNRELALDLMIMSSHIDKVLKFAHLASPVRDVLKILRNKSFSAMLESVDPTAQSDMLLPWLTRAARQITEEPTKGQGGPMVDGFFRAIRQRSGMGLMFANVVNVAQQVTGFSVAALTVKPKYLASGLIRYTRNPMAITKAIRQASPMMADRGDNQLASMYGAIDKIIDKNDKYGQARDWFGRHTYFMQQGVQNVMDVIVWAGAYDQALAGGSTETEAARQGDAAVRQTQGSTFAEDVSRIETGTPMLRSFVHMYGYFNMWGNLLSTEMRTAVSELGLKKGAGRLMFVYIAGFAIPALLAQMIADGLRGQLPEDEDDDGWLDEWMSWFFGTQAKTATAFAPIVGQAINAIGGAYTSVPYDDRIAGSPAISAIEGAMRTISGKTVYDAIAEDGDKSKAIKDVLSLMTLATGIPFQALSRPVGYAVDVAEGDIEPTSELDYIRGLVTGTASEASRQ